MRQKISCANPSPHIKRAKKKERPSLSNSSLSHFIPSHSISPHHFSSHKHLNLSPLLSMAISDTPRRSLIPTFLYSSSSSSTPSPPPSNESPAFTNPRSSLSNSNKSPSLSDNGADRRFWVASPSEDSRGKIKMYSPAFYAACTAGGTLCCGLTHTALTPLDLVKCNMQVFIINDLLSSIVTLFLGFHQWSLCISSVFIVLSNCLFLLILS